MFKRITIYEYERGLRYTKGRFTGVVDPGRRWIWTPSTRIITVDVRPKFISVPGQEVLSSDGVTLKVSLAASYQFSDLDVAFNKVENYYIALYQALQLALRKIVGENEIEAVLEARGRLGQNVFDATVNHVTEFGIELLDVDLKDIMFPGSLKNTFAQVVNARKEGEAALEKARGETAALRNLANAASMMRDNPMLLQVRLLQQLAGSSGNTVVLGFPPGSTPLPVREGDQTMELPGTEPDQASE